MDSSQASALAPTRVRHKVGSRAKNAKWTEQESDYLVRIMTERASPPNWNDLAAAFPGKTPQQISERWEKVLDPKLVKGSWKRQEDEIIIQFVREKGVHDWTKLSVLLPGRIGKQCRERWHNHLDPCVKTSPWTEEEDSILIEMVQTIGTKWVKIAESLPGRSDNSIKNRWHSTLKKKLEYERNGGVRPKRGRPSHKSQLSIKVTEKPHSANEFPKPPRLCDVPDIRGFDSPFASTGLPISSHFMSPFASLKSPFSGVKSPFSISPGGMSGAGIVDDIPFGCSPQMFSLPARDQRTEFLGVLSPVIRK